MSCYIHWPSFFELTSSFPRNEANETCVLLHIVRPELVVFKRKISPDQSPSGFSNNSLSIIKLREKLSSHQSELQP